MTRICIESQDNICDTYSQSGLFVAIISRYGGTLDHYICDKAPGIMPISCLIAFVEHSRAGHSRRSSENRKFEYQCLFPSILSSKYVENCLTNLNFLLNSLPVNRHCPGPICLGGEYQDLHDKF